MPAQYHAATCNPQASSRHHPVDAKQTGLGLGAMGVCRPHHGPPFSRQTQLLLSTTRPCPTGIIGTNLVDAEQTVDTMASTKDTFRPVEAAQPGAEGLRQLLGERGVQVCLREWLGRRRGGVTAKGRAAPAAGQRGGQVGALSWGRRGVVIQTAGLPAGLPQLLSTRDVQEGAVSEGTGYRPRSRRWGACDIQRAHRPTHVLLPFLPPQIVDFKGWQAVDAEEVKRGAALGKPRDKLTDVQEMLQIAVAA